MISLAQKITRPWPGRTSWWQDGAVYVADFANNRYMKSGTHIARAEAIDFARASSKHAQSASGAWLPFAPDSPAITDRGISVEPASMRVSARPATPTNWNGIGTAATVQSGAFLGLFSNAARVASTGQTWHRIQATNISLTGGETYGVTVLYAAGTSGRCRIILRHDNAQTESTVTGPVGHLDVASSFAGTISGLTQDIMNGGIHRIRLLFQPTSTSASFCLGMGPDSTTAGTDIVMIAGWVETSSPSSPILDNPSGQALRAADTLTLKLPEGPHDLKLTFEDDSEQIIAGVSGNYALDPAALYRRMIRRIAAM